MKNMSPFQLVLTGVFAAFILIGMAFFALFRSGGGSDAPVANVSVWGYIPEKEFNQVLAVSGIADNPEINITSYVEVDLEEFDQAFIEALASGNAPDIVMLPHTSLLRHRDKILPIPYDTYPERTFRSTFIQQGELFLSDEGVLAVPFLVDPIVMYWNRTLFSNAGFANPPDTWDDFFNLTERLTFRDQAGNITQSAISFGEYQNVTNAKEILSALIMQAGSPITIRTEDSVRSTLTDRFNQPVVPTDAAVSYYTEFSNPVKRFYSWNRSLPLSQDYFVAGDLAVYFGFASEIDVINAKNPNLNFDIAVFPQSSSGEEVITFGNMTALAIPRASKDIGGAFRTISALTSNAGIQGVVTATGLPPVRRDLLSDRPSDPFLAIFYDSALWSRAWLDPDKTETGEIFKSMIENITSGRRGVAGAVQTASSELQRLLTNVSI